MNKMLNGSIVTISKFLNANSDFTQNGTEKQSKYFQGRQVIAGRRSTSGTGTRDTGRAMLQAKFIFENENFFI